MPKTSEPTPPPSLKDILPDKLTWVSENTAILIVHGIGNQLPLETLDQFGRGLIKEYRSVFKTELTLTHELVSKPSSNGVWFDNVLRIHNTRDKHYIDLYEYYWANYSQDKATWKDLNTWLQGVVKGADKFYKQDEFIGERYHDKSIFFDSQTGKFKRGRYWFFLVFTSKILLILSTLYKWLIGLVSLVFGKLADTMLQSYLDSKIHDLINVISEVSIYNVFDPKSKFYNTHRTILDGAVNAITYLLERPANTDPDTKLEDQELYYPSVIIAGHSLGTQVTYDAINKVNLLINMNQLSNYDNNGVCKFKNKNLISTQLKGYITFGSPLDKVVFFLRQNVDNKQFLMQQFLDNYHEFKQRNWDFNNNARTNEDYLKASCGLKRLLEDVKWRNYFDSKDYVSGSLDYYSNLTNVNCHFTAGTFGFTHSYYWDCENFYKDIIYHFLHTQPSEEISV